MPSQEAASTAGTSALGGATRAGAGSGGAVVAQGGSATVATGGKTAAPVTSEQLYAATAVCGKTPWVLSGLVANARGLGGIPFDGGSITCNRIFRGAKLATLGVAGCDEFASLGIRSVIDLRTPAEVASAPSPDCVTSQAKVVAAPMPVPYNLSPANYIADLHAHDSLLAAFALLGDVASYPVFFHCTYGRDRTAVFAALLLRLFGVSREVVMTEYMRTEESGLGTAPLSLAATLDEIERLGGAEAFLLSIGVPKTTMDVLRDQAMAGPTP